ncbi:MAG: four-carbon acid sugar kinase family protein [Tissierellia bacterium]|nr:four-carbon acid sugar kinase family protein [Tissierellia bacterium]
MGRHVVIADDLTGANANCSLMKKIGLTSASILNLNDEIPKDFDMIALTTDSRGMPKEHAYAAVHNALSKVVADDVTLYSKRVDSTLRGNIGTEINAFFDVLGENYMAIAVPVYPSTGRVVVNSTMLVNGELLVNSDAGKDTKTPVSTSNVGDLFSKDFQYKTNTICIEDIEKGYKKLSKKIIEEKKKGVKLLIFDGVTDLHLQIIAKAVLDTNINFFTVDPGPFTMEVAREQLEKDKIYNKVLMVVGSVTDITINQIRELVINYPVNILMVDASELANQNRRNIEIKRACEEAKELLKGEDILLITTTPYQPGQMRINLKELSKKTGLSIDEISILISEGLAEIACKVIHSDNSFAGVFISGGDITVAFANQIKSTGIEIREEVIPLAAYGRFIHGTNPGLRVISKGGMVGDINAMKVCLEKLKKD